MPYLMIRHHVPQDALLKEELLDRYLTQVIDLVGEKAVILLDCAALEGQVVTQVSVHTWEPFQSQIAAWHRTFQKEAQAQGTQLEDLKILTQPPLHYNEREQYS